MIVSALIAFLAVNTYYHQQLKGQNDEKNMNIVKSIASFIESNKEIDLANYLETQSAVGYKLYVVNENKESSFYGEPFRAENLSSEVIDKVMNGEVYHGMRDLPSETFVTGFFSNNWQTQSGFRLAITMKSYALFLTT